MLGIPNPVDASESCLIFHSCIGFMYVLSLAITSPSPPLVFMPEGEHWEGRTDEEGAADVQTIPGFSGGCSSPKTSEQRKIASCRNRADPRREATQILGKKSGSNFQRITRIVHHGSRDALVGCRGEIMSFGTGDLE